MPNFEWLKELQNKNKKAKGRRNPNGFGGMPIGARYRNDTGFGEDGRLQPNMPVSMVQTTNGPKTIHEGEQFRNGPNGSVDVISQKQLLEEEQRRGISGFQQGGNFRPPDKPIIPRKITPFSGQQIGNQALTPKPITGPLSQQGDTPLTPKPITGPLSQQGDTPLIPDPITGPFQTTGTVTYPTTGQTTGGPDVDPDQDQTVEEEQDQIFTPFVQNAMDKLKQMSEGGSPAQKAAFQKAMDQLKATQATERRVGAQQAAQQRVGGVEANTRALEAARSSGMALAEATAQFGIGDLQIRENAIKTMAQIGLQGMALEQAGDQWAEQMAFAREQYGDKEGQRIFADINAGMTLEQIQAKYPGQNITADQFSSMQNATPTSQWEKQFGFSKEQFDKQFAFAKEQYDFDKQVSAINSLIAQGGAENFAEASGLFKEMFGEDIDFSNAISEENADNFNDGMAQLSTYIATGMDWETAFNAMKKDGTFDKLGMSEGDVEKMYNQMRLQSNPIWQANQALDDLVSEGLITEEQKDTIFDTLVWSFTNQVGITKGLKYVVRNADGKEIKAFDTEEEANKFLTANPDEGWNWEKDEDYISLDTDPVTDPNITPVESFNDFELSNIPEEFTGDIGQSGWEAAGKPETWEDYVNFDFTADIEGSLVDDGSLDITKTQLKNLGNSFLAGNENAVSKYGASEDSVLLDQLLNPGTLNASLSEINKISADALKEVGKIMKLPNGDAGVILSVEPQGPYLSVVIMNTQTGLKETIRVKLT